MLARIYYFFTIFIFVNDFNLAFSDEIGRKKREEVIQLEVGDTLEIADLGEGDVELSRSGVLDLTPKGDSSWIITALRTGFVLIKYDLDGQRQVLRVSVQKEKKVKEGAELRKLSFKNRDLNRYRIALRVFLAEKNESRQRDLNFSPGGLEGMTLPRADEKFSAFFQAAHEKGQVEILGSPVFVTLADKTVSLASGHEFSQEIHQESGQAISSWKETGLRLTIVISDVNGEDGITDFNLKFSNSSGKGRDYLSKSDIDSSTQFTLGKTFLLVSTQLNQNVNQKSTPIFLESIPFIGFLVGLSRSLEGSSNLYAFAQIDRLKPGDDIKVEAYNPLPSF